MPVLLNSASGPESLASYEDVEKLVQKMIKENKNKNDERMAKIEKKPKEGAPGDYNDAEIWKKFSTKKNEFKVGVGKREPFTDTYKKLREFIPGPGKHHMEYNKIKKLTSQSPPSLKIKRH